MVEVLQATSMRWLMPVIAAFAAGCAGTIDHREIRAVLDTQVAAWNRGDIEGFMAGYWKSDELLFSTPTGSTQGWNATLDRYRKRYPTPQHMGRLHFDGLSIRRNGPQQAIVDGRYALVARDGRKTGRFRLTFRHIHGSWVIIRDDTVPDA
jgi:uncharacterized protein (TIGR02246 family)